MAGLNGMHHNRVGGLDGSRRGASAPARPVMEPVTTYSRNQRILPLQGDVTGIGWD